MEFRTLITRRCSRQGFTMTEMIVVMAIVGILIYLTVPSFTSIQSSSNLSLASQTITDEIAVARDLAASRNQVVEIRLISPTGSAGSVVTYSGFHDLQLWAPGQSGVSAPVDRVLTLPEGMEISGNTALSPLATTLAGATTAAARTAMPTGSTAGSYTSFFIRPAGNVTVAAPPTNAGTGTSEDNANGRAPQYFLTILSAHYDAAATLPTDYVTVQVNPDTGRTQSYRP